VVDEFAEPVRLWDVPCALRLCVVVAAAGFESAGSGWLQVSVCVSGYGFVELGDGAGGFANSQAGSNSLIRESDCVRCHRGSGNHRYAVCLTLCCKLVCGMSVVNRYVSGVGMSRILILASVATSWMLLAKGYAQAPSIREGLPFNLLSADARTAAHPGMWKEVIENRGSSALVALHATFHCGTKGNILYNHDPLFFYGRDKVISPEGRFEIDATDPAECPGGIYAAIFSDGHTEGNPFEVDAIFQRRRGIYEGIGSALTLLDDMAANKRTALQVQSSFSDLEASAYNDHTLNGPEKIGMRIFFEGIRLTIKTNQGVLITPSDRTTVRQPTYDQIAAKQNISMDQAQAMVIAKKLREWRADLEGFLSPARPK
jgi:hypothetical protein